MWREGTIGIPDKSGKRVVCHYWIKHFDEPSEFGIDGGRISKLRITQKGVETCNYDRGWDKEPDDEITEIALAILVQEYN